MDPKGQTELDSHADTCVAGSNFAMLYSNGETAEVYSFSDESAPFGKIPIATAATAWTDESTGEAILLIFNECLFFGDRLKHSLLCPNQMRDFGHKVSDIPTQFDASSSHSIDTTDPKLRINLHLRGVISYMETWLPSQAMLDDPNMKRIVMTSDRPWKPYLPRFQEQEDAARDRRDASAVRRVQLAEIVPSFTPEQRIDLLGDETLYNRLIASVNVAADDTIGDGVHGHEDETIYPIGSDEMCNHLCEIHSLTTDEKSPFITKEILSRRWMIGLDSADRTLRVTTQRGVKTIIRPTDRRVKTWYPHLGRPTTKRRMYSDTLFAKTKSIRGNTCAQLWTDGTGGTFFYPKQSKSKAHETISAVIHDLGAIPAEVMTDNAKEETLGPWLKEITHYRIKQLWIEPYSKWQNRAEGEVGVVKTGIRRCTQRKRSPKALWDYAGEWVSNIRRLTALNIPSLDGKTSTESMTGHTPDISAYAIFDWYDFCWAINPPGDIATSRRELCNWIGVTEDQGGPLTYRVLPKSCVPITRSSVFRMTKEEAMTPEFIVLMADLDAAIKEKIGDHRTPAEISEDIGDVPDIPTDIFIDDEPDTPFEADAAKREADEMTPEAYDGYLTAEVLIARGAETVKGRVLRRKKNASGDPVGVRHSNPILDSREYEVEFADGSIDVLAANAIAEAMYAQVDDKGRELLMIDELISHKKTNDAVSKNDGFYPGTRHPKRTTVGWKLEVLFKDGSTSWIPLKDLKESNPLEVAEYAVANQIADEPAFSWWVRHFLRKRDRVIMKVKARYWKRTHQFGIELPKTIEEALAIDKKTGTDFWRTAVEKEMKVVDKAFEFWDDNEIPIGYSEIKCHMIFTVKMVGLVRKARFVADGSTTHDLPPESIFSTVVSRDSVRLFFLVCALNDLDVLSCDVQGAYLTAPPSEKRWTRAGKEFGENEGRPALVVRALYGMRSSSKAFRDHMTRTLIDAGFTSSLADGDVFFRAAVKTSGEKYYEYLILYSDDICCGSEDPKSIIAMLERTYDMKPGSVKEPDTYLGADVRKVDVGVNGRPAWGLSADTYVKNAVEEVERELNNSGMVPLPKKVASPMTNDYRPECDASKELDARRANYYQGLIGVLRWICELGRVDILVEVSMLSQYLTSPREGHLDECLHIFAYLKKYNAVTMVFDWTHPTVDESLFKDVDWSSQYPGVAESIPTNAPEPRGKPVSMTCFVDADHAGCQVTRRSRTGVLIYVNRAPIVMFSKRQNTVESSTFGSEFVALRISMDLIEALRYKIRMMGIPMDVPCEIYCDNESVVKQSTAPEATLKKKHNSICWHRCREAQAAGHVRVGQIPGDENVSDVFTKSVYGEKRWRLYRRILWK